MTLQELYAEIGGNYEQATRVLRIEKLIDKHIRKFSKNGVVEKLLEAGEKKDPVEMFECAHALKGICANLGLSSMSEAASDLAEEYREGNARKMTDDEVSAKLGWIGEQYKKTAEGIRRYEEG